MVYVAVPVAAVVFAGTSFAPFIVAPKCVAGPDEPPHAASANAAAMKLLFSMISPSGCEPPRGFDSTHREKFPRDKGGSSLTGLRLLDWNRPPRKRAVLLAGSVQTGPRRAGLPISRCPGGKAL